MDTYLRVALRARCGLCREVLLMGADACAAVLEGEINPTLTPIEPRKRKT